MTYKWYVPWVWYFVIGLTVATAYKAVQLAWIHVGPFVISALSWFNQLGT